jgi:hypothetical protein
MLATSTLLPAVAYARTFADIVNNEIVKVGNTIINLLYALSFIFFLVGIVRTLFSDNAEKRAQGRQLAIWGIIAFAVIAMVWGLVNFLLGILTSFAS